MFSRDALLEIQESQSIIRFVHGSIIGARGCKNTLQRSKTNIRMCKRLSESEHDTLLTDQHTHRSNGEA